MDLNSSLGLDPVAVLALLVFIWGVVGLGLLLWYLWAMARLFPRIGLRSGEGWIPIWNEWKLIDRAALPGWIVVFYLLPGLAIVPVIFRIIAMHRVGREAGVGAGYTVLGVFLPPLWATLLGSRIGDRIIGGALAQPSQPMNPYAAGAAPGFSTPQKFAPEAPAAPAPQAFTPPVFAPAVAPPTPVPAQPWAADASAPHGASVPTAQAPLGGETEAEYARLAAESFNAPPAVPLGQVPAPEPFSWTAASQPETNGPPTPPALPVPPVHPAAAQAGSQPVFVAPPVPPAPSTPPAPATSPVAAAASIATPPGQPAASPFAPQPITTEPAPAARKSTGITGMFDPVPAQVVAESVDEHDETRVVGEDLDQTVVVSRSTTNWVLELPDGSELALERDTVLGRRPEARDGATLIAVPDPTRTMSKSHARLRFDGATWMIEDLGSTNGIVLFGEDGAEVELSPGTPVAATERMLLGTLEVRLRRGGDAA